MNHFHRRRRLGWHGLTLALTWALSAGLAQAACERGHASGCVQAMGEAALPDDTASGRVYARQMALRQALLNASQRCHVQVQGFESGRDFQLRESAVSIRSSAAVNGFSILKEDVDTEAGIYRLRVKACLQPVSSQCPMPLAARYQPRLAVAAVAVMHPEQARDIRNLRAGWQRMLVETLRAQGWRNVMSWDRQVLLQPGVPVVPQPDQALLDEIREATGAHYLLLTIVQDLGMDRAAPNDALGRAWSRLSQYYAQTPVYRYRALAASWQLVDLNSGQTRARRTLRRQVAGDVRIGRERPFGGAAFMQTETGRALAALIRDQAEEVRQALQCAPWEGEILEVQKPDDADETNMARARVDASAGEVSSSMASANDERRTKIIFFAHAESGLQIGDVVTLYRRQDMPVRRAGKAIGWRSEPAGFAEVTEITPRFAVAEVIGSKRPIRVGDRVRGW